MLLPRLGSDGRALCAGFSAKSGCLLSRCDKTEAEILAPLPMIVYRVVRHEQEPYANVETIDLPDLDLGTWKTLPKARKCIAINWHEQNHKFSDMPSELTLRGAEQQVKQCEKKTKSGYWYRFPKSLHRVGYSIEEVKVN